MLYAVTLACFAASILRNLPSILGDIRRNLRLLVPMGFFLFGLWLELFVRVPTTGHRDLQKSIINGGVAGYVVLFVILPMAFAIIAARLPLPRRQNRI
jgi:hypothetical protein